MPQRLSIVSAQVKTGNKSKTVLNETCQKIYSLSSAIKFTKKQCNNIMSSVRYNTSWLLYLWILKIVKYLIFIFYYSYYISDWKKIETYLVLLNFS